MYNKREGKTKKTLGNRDIRAVEGMGRGAQSKQDGRCREFEGGGLAGVEKIVVLDGGI